MEKKVVVGKAVHILFFPHHIYFLRGSEGGCPPVEKTQARYPTDKPKLGRSPAQEGGFRRRGWVHPHAHHVRQRNLKRLRRQGH